MSNAGDFLQGLERADKRMRAAAAEGLSLAGQALMSDCIKQMPAVPLDEGTLRGSGSVHVDGVFNAASPNVGGQPTPNTDNIETTIGDALRAVVGFNTDYAAAQHEGFARRADGKIIEFHNYSHSGTGAKYMEIPMAKNAQKYLGIVAREMQGVAS